MLCFPPEAELVTAVEVVEMRTAGRILGPLTGGERQRVGWSGTHVGELMGRRCGCGLHVLLSQAPQECQLFQGSSSGRTASNIPWPPDASGRGVETPSHVGRIAPVGPESLLVVLHSAEEDSQQGQGCQCRSVARASQTHLSPTSCPVALDGGMGRGVLTRVSCQQEMELMEMSPITWLHQPAEVPETAGCCNVDELPSQCIPCEQDVSLPKILWSVLECLQWQRWEPLWDVEAHMFLLELKDGSVLL
ncbi:hypothetical protein E2C01_006740 [Portunus trituberculatus]|uniref:Uncharacterized protein n=1 Tax=Portunus trituberculatus TaxID=210409 RepID=A0A5B7D0G7_PORTR|nr:hypothetical protein [Portunus trituberculatus]